MKDFQATREVFIPHKRTSSTSELEISSLLWVIFALLNPGSSRVEQIICAGHPAEIFPGRGCRSGESNPGLPYSSPARSQLRHAAPFTLLPGTSKYMPPPPPKFLIGQTLQKFQIYIIPQLWNTMSEL